MADARDTKMQENGSLVFFEHLIEKGKEPSAKEMLKVYDGYDIGWKITYRKQ